MITYAVLDDEEEVLTTVCQQISKVFKKYGSDSQGTMFSTGQELKNSTNRYDIYFLDIDMPMMDGITVAKAVREREPEACVIFVSSREDRVYDSFCVQPFRFVRKDYFFKDLDKAISAFLEEYSHRKMLILRIRNNTYITRIPVAEIVYIESRRNYQEIHTVNESEPMVVYSSMSELEDNFTSGDIWRIHKGCFVNFKYVKRIEEDELVLTTGESLFASRRKIKEVQDAYLHYLSRSLQ